MITWNHQLDRFRRREHNDSLNGITLIDHDEVQLLSSGLPLSMQRLTIETAGIAHISAMDHAEKKNVKPQIKSRLCVTSADLTYW